MGSAWFEGLQVATAVVENKYSVYYGHATGIDWQTKRMNVGHTTHLGAQAANGRGAEGIPLM